MAKQFAPRVIVKEEFITITIPKNTGTPKTKIQFPDNQNLRFSHLMDIEVFHFADFPMDILTRSVVIPEALLKSIFITLQAYDGMNFVWNDPAIVYHTNSIVSERHPSVFCGQKVNYPKSYIEIADSSLISAEQDQVLPLRILYRLYDAAEKKGRKAEFSKRS